MAKAASKPLNGLKPRRRVGIERTSLVSISNVRLLERRFQVMRLRREGCTVAEIAATLGHDTQTIRRDITEVLNYTIKNTAETADENRQLQIERLDGLLKRYYALATGGSLAAAAMVLQIETRRAKLLALDIPDTTRLELTGIREYVGIDLEKV